MAVAQIVENEATLSHGRTEYLEAGSGQPIILLHEVGFAAGGIDWRFNIDALSACGRVLAPDFVGWGRGDRLQQEYSFAYLVDFVREFQDALRIERAHILGQSMGGWIAGLLAYESPDRVDKLVPICAGGITLAPGAGLIDFHPPTRAQIKEMLMHRVNIPGVDFDALADRAYANTQAPGAADAHVRVLNHMGTPETRQRYNLIRRLHRIKAPTLVISGDHDSRLKGWQEHYQKIPGARMEVVPDAGHFVSAEKPDEFNALVTGFLSGGV